MTYQYIKAFMLYFYILISDNKESDAYISYSHDNEADFIAVDKIRKVLEEQGYRVIIRDRDYRPGAGKVPQL